MSFVAFLIVFGPLAGALLAGFAGQRMGTQMSQRVTAGFVILSAVLSYYIFYEVAVHHQPFTVSLFRWIESGAFTFDWALRVDTLTAVMLIVVTTVSAVVHVYSIGYMHGDETEPKFMAYLSLFTFAMLMLVTADNLVQMFFGWEGVGVCSYLLIGYYYKKPSANAAAIKAFVVNRVGDFGFALGIFGVFMLFGSVNFDAIFAGTEAQADATLNFLGVEMHAMTILCLLLFIGAMGKSAQLGLHTWLPDAMEGPTPVSALIHAATMVTAGVFMVARLSPLFELAPIALGVVTVVGAATALFAATVGLTQFDIKRVIAYSTCSQLGYMFFALGVGGYSAAMFHLMTHAFFKALLFLGAGSVIHALHHEQDMRKMGGIRKKVPVTYWMMMIGSLALAGVGIPGVFGLAGFYSKDLILESAFAVGGVGEFAFWIGIIAAFMTAFYSFRLIFLTFHGEYRGDPHTFEHAHESPKVMLIPLFILCTGAIFAGWFAYDWFGEYKYADKFWNGALVAQKEIIQMAHAVPTWVKWAPLIVGLAGIGLSAFVYLGSTTRGPAIARTFRPLNTFFFNKWYFDELYEAIFIRPAMKLGNLFWKSDARIVDRFGPNGVAWLAQSLSKQASRLQSGYVYHYAFAMLLGVVILLTWYVLSRAAV